jgi:hypothetical protein
LEGKGWGKFIGWCSGVALVGPPCLGQFWLLFKAWSSWDVWKTRVLSEPHAGWKFGFILVGSMLVAGIALHKIETFLKADRGRIYFLGSVYLVLTSTAWVAFLANIEDHTFYALMIAGPLLTFTNITARSLANTFCAAEYAREAPPKWIGEVSEDNWWYGFWLGYSEAWMVIAGDLADKIWRWERQQKKRKVQHVFGKSGPASDEDLKKAGLL